MKEEKKVDKFIVIDGNSLLNRAFYALPLLQTKQGFFTNAIYGFISMLLRLLEEEQPNYLAVVFDTKEKTFRHKTYPSYKAHRDKAPPEMLPQIPMLKELFEAMGIAYFEKDGFEADDLVGTLAKQASRDGKHTLIVTGDKDLLQLIDDHIHVLLTKKGISQMEVYDAAKVKEDFGVEVKELLDLKALIGDKSDNVPGVPGIGEKTALKLLNTYTDLDELYQNVDEIKGKIGEKLKSAEEEAYLSKELVKIVTDVPLNYRWDDLTVFEVGTQEAIKLLHDWEMKRIVDRLPNTGLENMVDTEEMKFQGRTFNRETYQYVGSAEGLKELEEALKHLNKQEKVALYRYLPVISRKKDHPPEPDGGLVLATGDLNVFVNQAQLPEFIQNLSQILPKQIIAHDIKAIWYLFYEYGEVDLFTKDLHILDTKLMGYLLSPTEAPHSIELLSDNWLPDVRLSPIKEGWEAICERGEVLLNLYSPMEEVLKERKQWQLYQEIEVKLALILARMETRGITVDKEVLSTMEKDIDARLASFEQEIYELAGEAFNLNSPKQLGHILFEKLNLPVIKKTKTGYSTDASTLEKLAGEYEIAKRLLEYRQLYKLKTTYLVGLKELVSEKTQKIHTTFNQTITATGRLSSTDPNLQNIPIKLEEGRKIRKAFVVEEERSIFLAGDYSQIELRILAHVSQDKNLIQAFLDEADIHTRTASEVFGVPVEAVSGLMRSHAKAVNFGIVYGISDYGLATQLSVPRKKAKAYIDQYFERFPGVKNYMESVVEMARGQGYVTTLYERRRELPDINHKNYNIRSAAERTAINTPIQGTAADIIKDAMVQVEMNLEASGLLDRAKLILQVHDELILETSREVVEDVADRVKSIMEGVMTLSVPLIVDLKTGPNWYELTPYDTGRGK